MRKELFNRKISLFGAAKDIEKAEQVLSLYEKDIITKSEGEMRIKIMNDIEAYDLKCSILFNGNSVVNRKKLLKALRSVIKNGMHVLPDCLYEFFSLYLGSIAHYNKYGWIEVYPTIEDLRNFFRRNEFGCRAVNHIPSWHTDATITAKEMEKLLKV